MEASLKIKAKFMGILCAYCSTFFFGFPLSVSSCLTPFLSLYFHLEKLASIHGSFTREAALTFEFEAVGQ